MRFAKAVFLSMILATAACFAQTHPQAPVGPPRYFGAIDLGSSGTKGELVLFYPEAKDQLPKSFSTKIIDTSLVSSMRDNKYTPEGISDAISAVLLVLDGLKKEATKEKLPVEVYYVTGSSGVALAANKQDLAVAVKKATGIDMDFIDAKAEGFYGLTSAARQEHDETRSIFIDIGSGNTKVGCVVGDIDIKNFKNVEIPYGSKKVLDAARKKSPSDLVLGIDAVMKDIDAYYSGESENIPCLRNRQHIYWTGGAAWATTTFMHPEAALLQSVKLTKLDLDRFEKELRDGSWNQKQLVFAFPNNTPQDVRAAIRKEEDFDVNDSAHGVINIFTRDQILSGVSIMQTVLKSSNPSAQINFLRLNDFILGFATDKFEKEFVK